MDTGDRIAMSGVGLGIVAAVSAVAFPILLALFVPALMLFGFGVWASRTAAERPQAGDES